MFPSNTLPFRNGAVRVLSLCVTFPVLSIVLIMPPRPMDGFYMLDTLDVPWAIIDLDLEILICFALCVMHYVFYSLSICASAPYG